MLSFPTGFRWGVATASHQCEGDTTNNQWYVWERDGHIKTGDRVGRACDWWATTDQDFTTAQHMGLNALRLSLEWSRIEPRPGEWDVAAIARYRTMLTDLRTRGIEPLVTLHHFTHPIWFEAQGGWLAPGAPERFARYAAFVVAELGDLCDFWCTINEPNVVAIMGYQIGDFPPGHRGDFRGTVQAQAQLARAHAAAYQVIHAAQPAARVSWAHHYNIFDPAHPANPLDRAVAALQDAAFNDFFPRAVLTGQSVFPFSLFAGDLRAVRGTCDFVGLNAYARDLVAFDLRYPLEVFGRRFTAPGAPQGDLGVGHLYSEAYPQGLVRLIQRVAAFGQPIYITENGIADASDRLRPWLLVAAVRAMHQALAAGADVRGYYHWSLTDNFEWAEGWGMRFGLIALDPATQIRTPRRSAALYNAIAHANALTLAMIAEYAPDALNVFGKLGHNT